MLQPYFQFETMHANYLQFNYTLHESSTHDLVDCTHIHDFIIIGSMSSKKISTWQTYHIIIMIMDTSVHEISTFRYYDSKGVQVQGVLTAPSFMQPCMQYISTIYVITAN